MSTMDEGTVRSAMGGGVEGYFGIVLFLVVVGKSQIDGPRTGACVKLNYVRLVRVTHVRKFEDLVVDSRQPNLRFVKVGDLINTIV